MLRSARSLSLVAGLCLVALPAGPAAAYVDLAPTLARVIRESGSIAIAEVERFSPDKGVVLLKKVRDLHGEMPGQLKHRVLRANETAVDQKIVEWAEPGRRCVVFVSASASLVCTGQHWYQVQSSSDGWWRLGAPRPDLPLAYYGTLSRLSEAIPLMLANKNAVITTLPHGADFEGASFDLALNRASIAGAVKVQRLRANLRMPQMVMAVSTNPAYLLGQGQAGAEEIPALREKLRDTDAAVRAESAADLGSLGRQASVAADDLAKLLDDQTPAVRMAAAAALLRIRPNETRALDALAQGLASGDVAVRGQAARAVGCAGAAAAPLAGKLGALLQDVDVPTRRVTLQSVAALGPAAAGAVEPANRLLEDSETAIDAADALGRVGPAARPAMKSLARMLKSDAAATRWAAVRAMSQIGGPDAQPAVTFMMRELRTAPEFETYNMLIYLALLGPVAKDAAPAVQAARLKNPWLRQATLWALEPTQLPWLNAGPMGMPFGEADPGRYIYESYVHELGDGLKPAATTLAQKIMQGTAGNVPAWGYKLLARFPQESLATLSPALAHAELVRRERAAVAIGYMGSAAAAAKEHVVRAIAAAPGEKEQRLLKWCLREIAENR